MDLLKNIRASYTPLQPTIKRADQNVLYREYSPHMELQPYIYCYWELKTTNPLDRPFTYRVVTDGCIDIFFELNDPKETFIMGFCKKYTEFQLDNTFQYIGIRFLPTVFPQLFKVNAATLSNQFQLLSAVVPDLAEFISSNFENGMCANSITSKLDAYFLSIIYDVFIDDDRRLYNAIDLILKHSGVVNLETDVDTGISQRQLRRLFNYYIGATPKSFCKVVQFQNILKAKPSTQSLKYNTLFYDLGYYDQSHFIKDFKNFYGVTPAKAFGRT